MHHMLVHVAIFAIGVPIASVAATMLASTARAQQHPTCPNDMVLASQGVCIDTYPWPNVAGKKPLLGVSAIAENIDIKNGATMNAEALCTSVGKRVCTLDEWTSACKGPNNAQYPWGDDLPKYVPGANTGICNYDKLFRKYDPQKVYAREPEHMAYLDQSEPAGNRQNCVSAAGAHDMLGAEQWVRCDVGEYGWCLVGRFWAEPKSCKHRITAHAPKFHWYTTTARCCLDVE